MTTIFVFLNVNKKLNQVVQEKNSGALLHKDYRRLPTCIFPNEPIRVAIWTRAVQFDNVSSRSSAFRVVPAKLWRPSYYAFLFGTLTSPSLPLVVANHTLPHRQLK